MTDAEQRHIFAKNLNFQISLTGKMQKEVADDLGIGTSTLNNWCKEVCMPKARMLQVLADYFCIGKAALLDDMTQIEQQGVDDYLFLRSYHQLTDTNKAVLKSTMMALLAAQDSQS